MQGQAKAILSYPAGQDERNLTRRVIEQRRLMDAQLKGKLTPPTRLWLDMPAYIRLL